MASRKSLRSQIRRARNRGVEVGEIDAEQAAADPELNAILRHWLASRRLPRMRFLVEPELSAAAMPGRIVLVARAGQRAVAYLLASPVPARNGFFIEGLIRRPDAPNGVSELLIDAAMRRFENEGRTYVTMGLVALARGSFLTNPWWLRKLMGLARAHGNRFYNFAGLESFRAGMRPARWEKVWFISNEPRFSLRAFWAVGAAFAGASPLETIRAATWAQIRTLARARHWA